MGFEQPPSCFVKTTKKKILVSGFILVAAFFLSKEEKIDLIDYQ